jgi:hypothetical protein
MKKTIKLLVLGHITGKTASYKDILKGKIELLA